VVTSTQLMCEKIVTKLQKQDELIICLTKVTIDCLDKFEQNFFTKVDH
jgi:hypothetical protein